MDGFNLYHGLKERNLRGFYWLNIKALIQSLLLPDQTLRHVHYFTSRVAGPPEKVKRQGTYIEALQLIQGVTVHFGHYVASSSRCRSCHAENIAPREKRTDVNIAAAMLFDAFANNFDNAILVSGDTDLIGPLEVMRQMFPKKKRTIAFPPGRHSGHLTKFATGWLHIGEDKFAKSLLPLEVEKLSGFKLKKPDSWLYRGKAADFERK